MWFNSLNLFSVQGLDIDEDHLALRLKENEFVPCKKHEELKSGWISPFGRDSDYLTPASNGCHLICLKIETRKVPADALKEEVEKKIAELKERDPEAKITSALKKNLKEEIRKEMLPYAFSKYEEILAYWDTKNNYLVVNVGSRTKSETFAEAFRNAISDRSFSVIPVQTKDEPNLVMSNWLINKDSPELVSPQTTVYIRDIADEGDGGIKYTKQDLEDDENLINYLKSDKTVSELELRYDAKMYLTVTEDFLVKGIKWDPELKETAEDEGNDDHASYVMSSFSVMSKTFHDLINYLGKDCFSGIVIKTDEDEAKEKSEGEGEGEGEE